MKIILSQGQGKLQLHQTAAFLSEIGISVKYISGWIPKKNARLVDAVGMILGKKDLFRKLRLRQPKELSDEDTITCVIPEIYHWALIILSKLKFIKLDTALASSWAYWGYYSKRHIKSAEIFHFRSGAGQGGAITKAKIEKMIVIADHSIAHPVVMKNLLIDEYKRFNKKYDLDPVTKFWSMVNQDCLDADFVIVNSDFVKETFLSQGYSSEKVKVLYLGVREDFIGIKKTWSINKDKPVRLLFIGAFGFRKGARILLEAMKAFEIKNANIVLDIVGNIDGMEEMINDFNLKNIKFHGTFVYDDLLNFLPQSDIFVFPTFAEGSARAAMEAMAIGLPVITTNNCGIPIIHNQSGFIIPHNDTLALVNEIERVIIDNEIREIVGRNATNTIKENYTWQIYTERLKKLYKSFLD